MHVPLTAGAYTSRAVAASAQRAVNLYQESNPPDAEAPVAQYPTPGLTLLAVAPEASWRCLYAASTGQLYGCAGQGIYAIDGNWALTYLGSVTSTGTPVSMIDNGLVLIIVDGTQYGYTIVLNTNAFAQLNDSAFFGSPRVDYLDTFLLFSQPGTANLYSSPSDYEPGIAFDPLYIAAKSGYPDPLQGVITMHRELWLIGTLTTEIWYDAGAPDFPFAILPGTFIEHGCVAPYSIIKAGLTVFWVSKDLRGQAIVMKGHDYQAQRVSTFAIENEWQTYPTLADCVTMTYQLEGHTFIDFVFPTANKTWSFDDTIGLWHEKAWTDNDGRLNRHRANCAAFAYGKAVCGDWQNGNLYFFDLNNYTDNNQPVTRLRGYPHLLDDNKRVMYDQFVADMQAGEDLGTVDGSTDQNPPKISLRWSDDRGRTYGNYVQQSLGGIGEYLTNAQFRRLGLGRDRVFELSWSVPTKTVLMGAFLTMHSAGT